MKYLNVYLYSHFCGESNVKLKYYLPVLVQEKEYKNIKVTYKIMYVGGKEKLELFEKGFSSGMINRTINRKTDN